MQTLLAEQQKLLRFYMIGVWNTAIHWTNRCTLWLFMKADTFCTFIRHDVIIIVRNRHLLRFSIHNMTAAIKFVIAFHCVAVADCPFYTAFIIALLGHSGSQAPQLMQSSVIIIAIILLILYFFLLSPTNQLSSKVVK